MTDLSPEQQAELHNLSQALQQEFADNEQTKTAREAKDDLIELKGEMLSALERTLKHGTIDQSSKVAMWGYGKLLEEGKLSADPIADLIRGMPGPTSKPTPSAPDEPDTVPTWEGQAVDIPSSVYDQATDTDED